MLSKRNENPSRTTDLARFAPGEMLQLLWQCHRQLRRMLSERLGGSGLSDTEFLVLWLCHRAEPHGLAQRDLAEALGVSPPQMSGLVERLRGQGLLTGRRCPLDRRRQLWRTDPAGCHLLTRICEELSELTVSLDRSIPPQQQQQLTELLRNLAGADVPSPSSTNLGPAPTADSPGLRVFQPDQQENHCATEARYAAAPRKTA